MGQYNIDKYSKQWYTKHVKFLFGTVWELQKVVNKSHLKVMALNLEKVYSW